MSIQIYSIPHKRDEAAPVLTAVLCTIPGSIIHLPVLHIIMRVFQKMAVSISTWKKMLVYVLVIELVRLFEQTQVKCQQRPKHLTIDPGGMKSSRLLWPP